MLPLARLAQFQPVAASPWTRRRPAPLLRVFPARQFYHRALHDARRPFHCERLPTWQRWNGTYCCSEHTASPEHTSPDGNGTSTFSDDLPSEVNGSQPALSYWTPQEALRSLPPSAASPNSPAASPSVGPSPPLPRPSPLGSTSLDQLRYTIDKVYTSSPLNRFVLFGMVTTILLLVGTLLISSTSMGSLPEAAWRAFLYITDAGSVQLAMDDGITERIVAGILCLLGLINFGGFVGLAAEAIAARIDELDRGFSDVLETDHIVVLGYNSKLYPLLGELVEANRSEGGVAIVLLSPVSKFEVEAQFKGEITEMKKSMHGSQIISRQGDPQLAADLLRVNVLKARSVIILAADNIPKAEERDAFVLRVLLALEGVARDAARQEAQAASGAGLKDAPPTSPAKWRPRHAHSHAGEGHVMRNVVAELESRSHVDVLQYLGKESSLWNVSHVVSRDLLSRLMVQAVFMPGITSVFAHLLSFSGSEFYFYPLPPDYPERQFGRLQHRFVDSILCGVWHPEHGLLLCPGEDYNVLAGESLVVLAEDNDRISLLDEPQIVWTPQDVAWFERRRAQQASTSPLWSYLRDLLAVEMQGAGECRLEPLRMVADGMKGDQGQRAATLGGTGQEPAGAPQGGAAPNASSILSTIPRNETMRGDGQQLLGGDAAGTMGKIMGGPPGLRQSARVKSRTTNPLQGKLRQWAVVIEEAGDEVAMEIHPEPTQAAGGTPGGAGGALPGGGAGGSAPASALPPSQQALSAYDLGDNLRTLLRLLTTLEGHSTDSVPCPDVAAAGHVRDHSAPASMSATSPTGAALAPTPSPPPLASDLTPGSDSQAGLPPTPASTQLTVADGATASHRQTNGGSPLDAALSGTMGDPALQAGAVKDRGQGGALPRVGQELAWSLEAQNGVVTEQEWPMLCDQLLQEERQAQSGSSGVPSSLVPDASRPQPGQGGAMGSVDGGSSITRADLEGGTAAPFTVHNGHTGGDEEDGPGPNWPIRVDKATTRPGWQSSDKGQAQANGTMSPVVVAPTPAAGSTVLQGVQETSSVAPPPRPGGEVSAHTGRDGGEDDRVAGGDSSSALQVQGGMWDEGVEGPSTDDWEGNPPRGSLRDEDGLNDGAVLKLADSKALPMVPSHGTSAGPSGSSGPAGRKPRPPLAVFERLWDVSPSTDFEGLTELIIACRNSGQSCMIPAPACLDAAVSIIRQMSPTQRRALLALLDDAGANGATILDDGHRDGSSCSRSPAWELPQKVLVCGWPNDVETIILSLDRYLAPGSEVTFMSPAGAEAAAARLQERSHQVTSRPKKVRVNFVSGDPLRRVDLERVRVEDYAAVLVTWDTLVGAQPSLGLAAAPDVNAADTNTIFVGTLIRHLQRTRGGGEPRVLVNELLGSRAKVVAELADVNAGGSFVFLNELTSMALAMTAEDPRSRDIMRCLFEQGQSELYLQLAVPRYADEGEMVCFLQMQRRAGLGGEILLGYWLEGKPVSLNPDDKLTPIPWAVNDRLILLSTS